MTKNKIRLILVALGAIFLSISLIAIVKEFGKDESKTQLETYFEPNQIEELNKLTEFVIGQIIKDCGGDQASCFNKYFDRFNGYDYEITGISKSKQSELLDSLSPVLFSDIWAICKGTRSYSEDSVVNVESLCPKTGGRFGSFLIDYCSNNNRLAAYGNTFEMAGDYPPSMTVQLLENPSTFDLSSKEELLLISVHLLTLNSEHTIIESIPND
ncbi:hypothetical protein [Algoriphagus aquimarinus]|uniref:Uncharacterized protein n=1 Tax=Algoriphagus aquimarinus TaxID=237018 RepID=A0A5C7AQJ1_9BACT|nr:hypothetical protein [Algoriphagus aquimarinus]TXE11036.1 hypothetical protein ESV85_12460 [Algoriphagus aquimarinus]